MSTMEEPRYRYQCTPLRCGGHADMGSTHIPLSESIHNQSMANLIDGISNDLSILAFEAGKRSLAVKLKAEGAMIRIQNVSVTKSDNISAAVASARDVLQAFIVACEETKLPKVVSISVAAIHRLIQHDAIHSESFPIVLDCLGKLSNAGLEEIKILQCILSLVSTTNKVIDTNLARAFSLCFGLTLSRDSSVATIATATLRQMTTSVFDRVLQEDSSPGDSHCTSNTHASDGFMLFQVIQVFVSEIFPILDVHALMYLALCNICNETETIFVWVTPKARSGFHLHDD
eukprot:gene2417-5359_t